MKKLLLLGACVLLASCSTNFYQVYKTQSENGSAASFEDANCKITYNLWAEGGNAGFSFLNKTDEFITLNLDQSFFVLNGRAYDYYQSRTFTNSTSLMTASGATTYFYGFSIRQGGGTSSGTSVAFEEKPTLIIPPHALRTVNEYKINEKYYDNCDLNSYPTPRQVKTLNFEKSTSPYVFYNSIAYTLGGKMLKVNNDFYVSEVTNHPAIEMYKSKRVEVCGKTRIVKVNQFESPDSFYYWYVRKN